MKSDVFNKPARLKNPPNLGDYDEVCRSFDWRSVRKELDWFDGTKINAAYNAIDRHTQTWRKNKVALYWEDETGSTPQYTL